MLLALDIGNSLIDIGFFKPERLRVKNLTTHPLKKPEDYTSILREFLPEISVERTALGVIISSVVEGHTAVLAEACKQLMPEDLIILTSAIMPGVGLMNESLAKSTSKLSAVSLNQPGAALGSDTLQCIQSGLFYGAAGAEERYFAR